MERIGGPARGAQEGSAEEAMASCDLAIFGSARVGEVA